MEGVHDAPSTLIWTPSLWPPTLRAWPSVHTLPSRFDTQHIYGGIPPTGGVVCEERPVRRAPDGTFVSIDGLVNGPSTLIWKVYTHRRSRQRPLPAPMALAISFVTQQGVLRSGRYACCGSHTRAAQPQVGQ